MVEDDIHGVAHDDDDDVDVSIYVGYSLCRTVAPDEASTALLSPQRFVFIIDILDVRSKGRKISSST